jgi:hypothetical protein
MNDLRKIYLIKKDKEGRATMGPTNPMVEAFLEKTFIHIGETYRGGRLDNSMPVFKFGAKELTQDLLDRGIVSERNMYSPLHKVSRASSKKGLYRLLGGRYMPASVFTGEAARSMQFPIIVKPINGWAGKGVRIISSYASLPNSPSLVYQEHLKIAHEYRFTMVKGKVIFVAERIPSNEKCKAIREGRESRAEDYDRNKFIWKRVDLTELWECEPRWFDDALDICENTMRQIELGVAGLDIAVTTEGRVYLLECNTSPGMTHDQSVLLYQAIFEDWYGRLVDRETKNTLDLFGEILEEARKRYVTGKY